MAKTLVIFDIDGTLVYSNKIDSLCFADTYQSIYGLEFPSIDWTRYPHVTDTTIFSTVIHRHFGREVSQGEVDAFQHQYVGLLEEKRRTHPQEFLEVPSACLAVKRLMSDSRFLVGIGTGGWLRPAHVKLRHVEIPASEMVVVGADGHEHREGIIGQVVDTFSAKEKIVRTVYVGDAIWDVNTTRKLGMNFIGVRKDGDFEVLEKVGAGTVLRDYSDYGRFLDAIFEAKPPIDKLK